ncbi:MAG: hypothetical protein ACYCQJ_12310 [Nitrososphaerales archaeon]
MELVDYSEKSWVVAGNTRPHKEELAKLGGKYNDSLREGVDRGWVFAKSKVKEDVLRQFIEQQPVEVDHPDRKDTPSATSHYLDETGEKVPCTLVRELVKVFNDGAEIIIDKDLFQGKLFLDSYSDKSWCLYGDTKPHKDAIKELGGRFNSNLKVGKGWIFAKSKTSEDVLRKFVDQHDATNQHYLHDGRQVPATFVRHLVEVHPVQGSPITIPRMAFVPN